MEFKPEEKIAVFDEIANNYFHKNFGSMTKVDLETLLFSKYIDHCIGEKIPFDDYTLSKELGITQSRVRSLKERKELKYPYVDTKWKDVFAESVKSAKYDKQDHLVKIIIQDVNVMNEIRHFIEEKGWYDEISLNRKLLRIPLDCFAEICIDDNSISELLSYETEKRVNAIAHSDDDIIKLLQDFKKEGLLAFLKSAGKEALLAVLPCLPFGGIAADAFRFLVHAIERS